MGRGERSDGFPITPRFWHRAYQPTGEPMKRMEESALLIMAGAVWPGVAFAEEAGKPAAGGYGGTDYVWFAVIGLILVYGAYDTFFRTP